MKSTKHRQKKKPWVACDAPESIDWTNRKEVVRTAIAADLRHFLVYPENSEFIKDSVRCFMENVDANEQSEELVEAAFDWLDGEVKSFVATWEYVDFCTELLAQRLQYLVDRRDDVA